MTLESAVTQLDYCDGHLLISTLDRSFICNTSLETFAQIGTKLRKGEFGGCFCRVNLACSITAASKKVKTTHHEVEESTEESVKLDYSPSDSGKFELSDCYEATEEIEKSIQQPVEKSPSLLPQQGVVTRVFCARPGSRVWEGDLSGKVLVTHQLKSALMVPPIDILLTDGSFGDAELLREDALKLERKWSALKQDKKSKKESIPESTSEKGNAIFGSSESPSVRHPPVSVAFTKMLNFYNSFLLAVSSFGLYVIDPSNSTVLLWVSEPDGVTDIKVCGNTLIYKTGHGVIQNFMVTTVDVAILILHNRNLVIECARLCLQHHEIFFTSRLLSRLGTKILSDLAAQIVDETTKNKIQTLEALVLQSLAKENAGDVSAKIPGITGVRNEKQRSGNIRENLQFALNLSHRAFLPTSVTRWYSDPYLGCGPDKSFVTQRSAVSVETSPIHELKGTRFVGGTSVFLQELQSSLSLSNSSDDTLQSISKSHSGPSSHSEGSDRKSSSSDPLYNRAMGSPTHSSGRWSQQSDRSQKSLESSQEMYEDPLFPPCDSSPELETATRRYLDGRYHCGNPAAAYAFYSLPYAPMSASSETAAIVQDIMENAATNVVSTITQGTKSLKEKLKHVAQMKVPGEMSPVRERKGPFSVMDILGNSTVGNQEDPFHSSTSGTDETDGFDVDIVIRNKPKKKGNRKALRTPSLSRSSTLPEVDDVLRYNNTELPGVVRNLHELVMSTMKQITVVENPQKMSVLLAHWLEVYCSTVQQIQCNKNSPPSSEELQDGPISISSIDSVGSTGTSCDSLKWDCNDIGFEPSAVSADILEQITRMFLHCLQSKVFVSGSNLKGFSGFSQTDVTQHPLTPDDIKKLDVLYAQLISNDCGLLHYATLLNALDTLGQHYYLMTWIALLEKVTKDSEVVSSYPRPDIISDLDFTRSQRVLLLFKFASGGNFKNFITAATHIQNPYVIFDVIFMLNFTLPKSQENSDAETKDYLFQYLNEMAQDKDIRELYLNYWSWCSELQYDILHALLSALNLASFSCQCGMPLPRKRRIPLENLAETLLAHHILDPKNMSLLCQNSRYWKGYVTLSLAYKLLEPTEIFPYALQTCDLDLIEMAMESLDVEELSTPLDILVNITSTNFSVIKCHKCQTIIDLMGKVQEEDDKDRQNYVFKFRVNGEPQCRTLELDQSNSSDEGSHHNNVTADTDVPPVKEGNCKDDPRACRDVTSVGQLWEYVVVGLLRRTKTTEMLKLLKSVEEKIPPGIIPQK